MYRPRLAVFKFASCDGCQLSLLNMEEELPEIARMFEIAYFLELRSRALPDYYDIALVEGSISTPEEVLKIKEVREKAYHLVAIGACATAGGIQALRNLADYEEFKHAVYPRPEFINALKESLPVSSYVHVDFELWGCPVSKEGLSDVLVSYLRGKRPEVMLYPVCFECKRKAVPCVLVTKGLPCLGPITKAGCGALCPSYGRDCYGCFGPAQAPNIDALSERFRALGLSKKEIDLRLKGINSHAFWQARSR